MKISGALKRLTKNIIHIVKKPSEEDDNVTRYNELLKLARRSPRFGDAADRALKAKIAVPVDPTVLKKEIYKAMETVQKEQYAVRDNATRSGEVSGEVQEAGSERVPSPGPDTTNDQSVGNDTPEQLKTGDQVPT